jgi:hypothetical protein
MGKCKAERWTRARRAHAFHIDIWFVGRRCKCAGCGATFDSYDHRSVSRYESSAAHAAAAAMLPITIFNEHNAWLTNDLKIVKHMVPRGVAPHALAAVMGELAGEYFDSQRLGALGTLLSAKTAADQTITTGTIRGQQVHTWLSMGSRGVQAAGDAAVRTAVSESYRGSVGFQNALRARIEHIRMCMDHHMKFAYKGRDK